MRTVDGGRVRYHAKLSVLAGLAVMAAVAVGCGTSGQTGGRDRGEASTDTAVRLNLGLVESDDAPQLGGKVVYGLNAETNGWNPATNNWAPAGLQVMRTMFDTLTAFDAESQIQPFLAESMEHNADYTDWKFTLRPGVVLHNGKPVTADVVARNQNTMKTSAVTSQAYRYVDSITAAGPDVVEFHLAQPFPLLPMIFATQIGVVSDPDWLDSNDGIHPVGSGPFVMDRWEIGNKLIVKKNPNYWQADGRGTRYPYLDQVEFRVITDNASRANALEAGDVDVIEAADPQTIGHFQQAVGDGKFQVFNNSKGEQAEVFIQLNNLAAPFDDPNARRALAFATDKQAIIDLQGGLFEPANGPFSPRSPWYAEPGYPQHDPTKAKDLVDKVKAEHGSFSFKIQGVAEASNQQLLQALQQQWQEVGIDVQIDTVEQAKLVISVITGSYQATQWEQFDSANPINELVWWEPDNVTQPPAFSLNFARHASPALGVAMKEWRTTADPAQRKAHVEAVQKNLATDVPYVWLYHAQFAIVATTKAVNVVNYKLPSGPTGLDLHMEAHPLYQVWLKK